MQCSAVSGSALVMDINSAIFAVLLSDELLYKPVIALHNNRHYRPLVSLVTLEQSWAVLLTIARTPNFPAVYNVGCCPRVNAITNT